MMSSTMAASNKRLEAVSSKLVAASFGYLYWVLVIHEEGTTYTFRNAFMQFDPEDNNYLWVLTEHQGDHVFAINELNGAWELHTCKSLGAITEEAGMMFSERQVACDALEQLLRVRDFLGYQLSHANGLMDDKTFKEIEDEYLKRPATPDLALLVSRARVLSRLISPKRLDSDVLSTVLDCDAGIAIQVLKMLAVLDA